MFSGHQITYPAVPTVIELDLYHVQTHVPELRDSNRRSLSRRWPLCKLMLPCQSFAPISGSISRPRMWPVAPFHSPTPRLYPQSLCVSMEQSASGRAMHSSAMPC